MLCCSLVSLFLSLSLVTGIGWYREALHPWPSVIISKLPHQYLTPQDIPSSFDWRDTKHISPPTNQFLPNPCGACWAHASTGALTDRFIMATGVVIPHLSMQVLVNCGHEDGMTELGTCEGGSDILAYQFIHQYGITDVTCSPYLGMGYTNWGEGLKCYERMCRQCDIHGNCYFINGTKYHISEYGSVLGELKMMTEIYARGPIACSVYAHTDSFLKYTGGILIDPTPYNVTTHVIVVTGWGVDEKGVKYWIGRNSFGSEWGEKGWFKLKRGTNTLNIEKHPCAWAVPQVQ